MTSLMKIATFAAVCLLLVMAGCDGGSTDGPSESGPEVIVVAEAPTTPTLKPTHMSTASSAIPKTEFTSVSAGRHHTCGVRTDGSVACWGNDEWGQSTPPTGEGLFRSALDIFIHAGSGRAAW